MTQDLCRAEFEKWYIKKYNDGLIQGVLANETWCAWQACYERFAKPATEHNPADTSQNVEY